MKAPMSAGWVLSWAVTACLTFSLAMPPVALAEVGDGSEAGDAVEESQPSEPEDETGEAEQDVAGDDPAADDPAAVEPGDGEAEPGSEAPVLEEADEPAATAEVSAATVASGDYYVSAFGSPRQVLDVKGGSSADRANVQLYGTNLTGAQKWRFTYDAETGLYTIACVGTGKVLDVAGGSTANRTNVQQYRGNGTAAQRWRVLENGDGTVTIESALSPEGASLVLDRAGGKTANGTNAQLYGSNGSAAQKWVLTSVAPQVDPGSSALADGWYRVASASNGSLALDIASGSGASGTNLQLYTANGTVAQCFKLTATGDGFYSVQPGCSTGALDAASANPLPGTNVRQYKANGTKAQQWALRDQGDGTYLLVNRGTGTALEVAGSVAKGANLQLDVVSGSAAQRFTLTPCGDFLSDGTYTVTSLCASKVLDVASGSKGAGANVQIYQSNGTQAQKWQVEAVGDGRYALRCVLSGLYLTMDAGGNVCQRAAASDGSQYWMAEPNGAGGLQLVNALLGMALDVAGGKTANKTNVQGYRANGTAAQSFSFASTALLANGTYALKSAASDTVALDVASGSTESGANVQAYRWNATNAQKWKLTRNADGSYTVASCKSLKCLDVASGVAADGQNVRQNTSNGTAAQRWFIADNGDGTFYLESALDRGYVLDLSGTANGSNACLREKSGAATQRFTFTAVSASSEGKIGWQNPSTMYQVSCLTCTLPSYAAGDFFCYVSPSKIAVDATRSQCVEAFIQRAVEYKGTPYTWGWAMAPGTAGNSGVDCSGLVIQCMNAVGMRTPYNSYNQYHGPADARTTSEMLADSKIKKVSFSQRQRGDIIFYSGHVAVYLGNDRIIHAWPNKGVVEDTVYVMNPISVGRLFDL